MSQFPTRLSVPSPDTQIVNLPLPASGLLEAGRLLRLVSGAPAYVGAGERPEFLSRIPSSATDPDVNRDRVTVATIVAGAGELLVECQDAVTVGQALYTAADGELSTTSSAVQVGVATQAKDAGTGLVRVAVDIIA